MMKKYFDKNASLDQYLFIIASTSSLYHDGDTFKLLKAFRVRLLFIAVGR